jgi:choline monooxygenase
LLGAPHFAQDPCLNLNNYPLQSWNGLLFEAGPGARNIAQDLAGMGAAANLDFSGYALDRVEMHTCNYNWKTFIEVYLEDYHVGPFHPGLGQFVTCDDLSWQFGQHYSVQQVGVSRAFGQPGSEVYRRWHDALLNYRGGKLPDKGAIWLTYYPHIMVEWYPHVLTVSTLYPQGPQKTLNMVEFYYPEEIVAFEREFVQAQQAAYMETCLEDDEIAERMDAGRAALFARGDNEVGPYQSPMEDGMQHFHEWYRRQLSV